MKIAAIILLICAVSQAQEVKNIGYGSDFQLDCSDVVEDQNSTTFEQWYDGSGNSLIWQAGGVDFKGSSWNADKMSVDFDAHTLAVNNAEFSDAGKYKCSRKGNEDYEKFFQVNVYGNPSTSAEATAQVVSGEDTLNVASCMITGTSKPYTIQWENENGEVVELPEASETVNADFAELVDVVLDLSLAVQSSSHNGAQYTCRVTHPLGTTSKDVSLIVTAGPTINNFSPSAQQTIEIGGSGNYECSAIGVPSAKVSWYGPNGEQITKDDETVSILEIIDASYSKSGTYKCVATNDVDFTQQTFELIVQGSPEITSPTDSGVTQVKAAENDKFVKVTCAAEAVPLPTITWSTPENTNATESVSDATSTLQIPVKAGQNAFSVNCTAANTKGSVERQFMITPPAATAGTAGMGMIIGILIAVLVLLAVIFFIVFRICTSRKQPVGDEECGEKDGDDCEDDADDSNQDLDGKAGCCAGLLKPKKATLVEEEDETKDINEVKESNKEDGTADEKQKLTEAEETPAAAETKDAECKDNGTTEHAEGENTENKEETAEGAEGESAEKSPKKKMKLSFPSSCFRKKDSKKDLQGQENDPEKVVEDEVNETEEQLTKESAPSSPQKVKEDDQDSGKGDTLDKGLEAPPAEEVEAK